MGARFWATLKLALSWLTGLFCLIFLAIALSASAWLSVIAAACAAVVCVPVSRKFIVVNGRSLSTGQAIGMVIVLMGISFLALGVSVSKSNRKTTGVLSKDSVHADVPTSQENPRHSAPLLADLNSAQQRSDQNDDPGEEQRLRDLQDPGMRHAVTLLTSMNRAIGAMMREDPDLYATIQNEVKRCQHKMNSVLGNTSESISSKTRAITSCAENILLTCMNTQPRTYECDHLSDDYNEQIMRY